MEITVFVVVVVADLDDAHCYPSSHVKPHAHPLDYHIGAFYFLPSALHATSISRHSHQQLTASALAVSSANNSAQFEDADV